MDHPELYASTNAQLKELLLQYNITNEDIEGTGVDGRITKMDRIRTIAQLYKHTKDEFANWQIHIHQLNNDIKIFNHKGDLIAYKRARTASLKSNYNYTISIQHGKVFIWIESHINIPFYTPIDDMVHDSVSFLNTPIPHHTFGRTPGHSGRKVQPHQCHFI